MQFYFGEKDSDDFARHLLSLLLKDPEFGKKINKNIRIYSARLKEFCAEIDKDFLINLSNAKLGKLYISLDELHTELYTWGWLPNAVDMFHANFTNYLKDFLSKKIESGNVNQALVALTASPKKSVLQEDHESLLNVIKLKQANVPAAKFNKALEGHQNRYFYLKHLWLGKEGVYDKKYYLREINKFIRSGENAKTRLYKESAALFETLEKRRALIKNLRLKKKEIDLFDVYADFAVTKLFRRAAQIYWAYKMDFIFEEIAKRLKIPIIMVRFMFPNEIKQCLENGVLDRKSRSELSARSKYCLYYAEKGCDLVLFGKEADQIEKKIAIAPTEDIRELEGQVACLGKAKGYAKIINSVAEMKKMRKGDILFSIATNPDIVQVMKLAAAIVTDQGGITSHAAIVSRELGTPCVIGTKIGTKVFKDGDLVEVDANKGVVRKI
ncbi:hypothetical protein D4Q76_02530 [archaeon]|nr:MAG: hypothetical protein D4Q76_02530 [archaeon]